MQTTTKLTEITHEINELNRFDCLLTKYYLACLSQPDFYICFRSKIFGKHFVNNTGEVCRRNSEEDKCFAQIRGCYDDLRFNIHMHKNFG